LTNSYDPIEWEIGMYNGAPPPKGYHCISYLNYLGRERMKMFTDIDYERCEELELRH